jgi:hypothetical protein
VHGLVIADDVVLGHGVSGGNGGTTGSSITVLDEGFAVGEVTKINFTGPGVTAAMGSGGVVNIDISGGGGGTPGPTQPSNVVVFKDNRAAASGVREYPQAMGLDFKNGGSVGLPGAYVSVVSLSGWFDDSGGVAWQMGFRGDAGGVHVRYGNAQGWAPWGKVLITDSNGNVAIPGAALAGVFSVGQTVSGVTGSMAWAPAMYMPRAHIDHGNEFQGNFRTAVRIVVTTAVDAEAVAARFDSAGVTAPDFILA